MDNILLLICAVVITAFAATIIVLWKRTKALKKALETDDFTTLLNYQGFCRLIQKKIIRKTPFCLAIIDIDNFRSFNRQGYKLGDDVLKEFCKKLKLLLPANSLFARFRMGDEFVLVFENSDIAETQVLLLKIKAEFLNYKFESLTDCKIQSVTFTAGIAEFATGINIEQIINTAENELIKNKLLTKE